uniref:Uncharacterized protein n=1 Tax=Rhizophora mucronata TaxID=61149 RepID=A0A2P2M2Q0_RHIMU
MTSKSQSELVHPPMGLNHNGSLMLLSMPKSYTSQETTNI